MSCVSDEQLQKENDARMAHNLVPMYTSKKKYYEQARVDPLVLGYDEYTRVDVTVAELKAELSTREHVPNKQESKALRKAKQQRNRQKGRRDR